MCFLSSATALFLLPPWNPTRPKPEQKISRKKDSKIRTDKPLNSLSLYGENVEVEKDAIIRSISSSLSLSNMEWTKNKVVFRRSIYEDLSESFQSFGKHVINGIPN